MSQNRFQPDKQSLNPRLVLISVTLLCVNSNLLPSRYEFYFKKRTKVVEDVLLDAPSSFELPAEFQNFSHPQETIRRLGTALALSIDDGSDVVDPTPSIPDVVPSLPRPSGRNPESGSDHDKFLESVRSKLLQRRQLQQQPPKPQTPLKPPIPEEVLVCLFYSSFLINSLNVNRINFNYRLIYLRGGTESTSKVLLIHCATEFVFQEVNSGNVLSTEQIILNVNDERISLGAVCLRRSSS
jgi:hypothetical protein